MARLTVTITDEQAELLDELSEDGGEYDSKSAAVRDFIQSGQRVAELEEKVDQLESEKRLLLEELAEKQDLVCYVEAERSHRRAGLATRAKWWLLGRDEKL